MPDQKRKRVFSAIQPTGNVHLGNYLGAIRGWTRLQDEYDCLFCIADLHAVTVPQDPRLLREKTRETARILVASGIDPRRSPLFVQSHICAHTEMAWLLNCVVPVGWLERMTQYKEKVKKGAHATAGLFDYPVLMAADVLLYDTDLVPVGEDQKQHIELTRDLAQRFNSAYGETFRLPDAMISESGSRIMGLIDPTKKMSKSEMRYGDAISVLDPPGEIRAKVMKATTDSLRDIRFDENRPGVNNLLVIYELFTGLERSSVEERFSGRGYNDLKRELAEAIIEGLRPLQSRYRELASDRGAVEAFLAEGASSASPMAIEKLNEVKTRMGLG
ncbi:MAG: tryptophan--tRNA ligase [Nitrospirae bacterium]|nr:tryptophan--tRNA ligase [Nitrospirota bacterium]